MVSKKRFDSRTSSVEVACPTLEIAEANQTREDIVRLVADTAQLQGLEPGSQVQKSVAARSKPLSQENLKRPVKVAPSASMKKIFIKCRFQLAEFLIDLIARFLPALPPLASRKNARK